MTTRSSVAGGPKLVSRVPGPQSRTWLLRMSRVAAPMGPRPTPGPAQSIVFARGDGANVWDVDGNRFVDLAAGFGSLLLGHRPEPVLRAASVQSERLLQAMGDVYPSDAKIGFLEQVVELFPEPGARAIVGQSGADAIGAALKTALLATGRPGVVALGPSYHGLSHAPLSLCGLRQSYRRPFAAQLNAQVSFLAYPSEPQQLQHFSEALERVLDTGHYGAVVFEPILGRGGVVPMLGAAASQLRQACSRHGVVLVADEIWTGLGRAGSVLSSSDLGIVPDVVCLGKGLGGGLPISVCMGRSELMAHWSQDEEVVHTSTFAGAPPACVTALAVLDVLRRTDLVERSRAVGERFGVGLRSLLEPQGVAVRGRGMMWGFDVPGGPGSAWTMLQALLRRGYLVSTGGGDRQTVVLTPPLNVEEHLLDGFVSVLAEVLRGAQR